MIELLADSLHAASVNSQQEKDVDTPRTLATTPATPTTTPANEPAKPNTRRTQKKDHDQTGATTRDTATTSNTAAATTTHDPLEQGFPPKPTVVLTC